VEDRDMRARLIEIAGGLVLGLVLFGASVGVTVVMGRLIEVRAGADASRGRKSAPSWSALTGGAPGEVGR
jgi:hypothetical protein